MDEYVNKISPRLDGHISIMPKTILLKMDPRMYVAVEEIAKKYVHPDKIWISDVTKAILYSIMAPFPNITKSICDNVENFRLEIYINNSNNTKILKEIGIDIDNIMLLWELHVEYGGKIINKHIEAYIKSIKQIIEIIGGEEKHEYYYVFKK